MLKAYAVALVLTSSAPTTTAEEQQNVRPLENKTETTTEVKKLRPRNCLCGWIN